MTDCDHCGHVFLTGEEYVEGEDGVYCVGTCRYDAEVLEVDADELPPRRGRG